MKRKVLSVLLVAAMTASMVAGCGTGKGSGETAGGGDTQSGGDPTADEDEHTLSVSAWDAAFNIPALKAAAEAYKKDVDPDFNLKINEVSQSSDIENSITLAGSSGDYSTLTDIVLFQDHWIQKYVADYPDAFQDVDDIDIDWTDFATEKLSFSTIDDKHYGVPVDNGTVVAAYRIDLLEQAGYTIDDLKGCTWDKFIEIGQKVYETTGKYLLSMDGDGNDLVYMMLQAEGESQFKDGKPNLVNNDKLVKIVELIDEMVQKNVLYLANDWNDYTNQTILGDMVAGVINGNWIIPTMEKVSENSGKWEITTMPTIEGGDGYASNGGASLYVTSNCKNKDLAEKFLAYTFGGGEGSTATYDAALTDGGVITTCISAGKSDVYNQGVEYFNNTPIYAEIVEMGSHVKPVEQSEYHYTCREKVAAAIINITQNGDDVKAQLQDAEDQLNFEMGN